MATRALLAILCAAPLLAQTTVTVVPRAAYIRPGATQQFTARVNNAANSNVSWTIRDSRGNLLDSAGTISGRGLYTAPSTPGNYYVEASFSSNAAESAVALVTVIDASQSLRFTDYFDSDKGVPIASVQASPPHPAPPSPAKTNRGQGLLPDQKMFVQSARNPADATTATQLDVISDAPTLYPGAFASNCLRLYDGDTRSLANYAVVYGNPLNSGVFTVKFFDPNPTGGVVVLSFGGNWNSATDPRVTGSALAFTLTLQNGTVTASGSNATKGLTYSAAQPHLLTIRFDRYDTSKGANGTWTFQVDGNTAGGAGFSTATAPDRFSINTGPAANTSTDFLLDEISVSGVDAAPVVAAPVLATSVDFARNMYALNPMLFGLSASAAFSPALANDSNYIKNLAFINPSILRFNNSAALQDAGSNARGWLNIGAQSWDADRIGQVMDATDGWDASENYAPALMITIPGFPPWLKTYQALDATGAVVSTLLDPSEYDKFASFCADLVRILNIDQQRGVRYFELLNEQDINYFVNFKNKKMPDKLDDMVLLFNKAAFAMKSVDSSIFIGGPAFAHPEMTEQVTRFAEGTVPISLPNTTIDFLTWHFYASTNPADSDAAIYNSARQTPSALAGTINKLLYDLSPDDQVSSWMDEFNIDASYRNADPRQLDIRGAVFDALAMISAADGGAAQTSAFTDLDPIYGKMSPDYEVRPSAYVLHMFNDYIGGNRVATSTADDKSVVMFAAISPADSIRSLVLVNRTPFLQRVTVDTNGYIPSTLWNRLDVTSEGFSVDAFDPASLISGDLWLPQNSVTLLTVSDRP
jgi:hypothetical protein